ncbi:MAG: hypothetical protein M3R72_02215 [Bacteroidota bacterium]|nr:hypothetical protein [Bacteroidota bacterium]
MKKREAGKTNNGVFSKAGKIKSLPIVLLALLMAFALVYMSYVKFQMFIH